MNLWRNMSISAAVLSIFAISGTSLVAWTFYSTQERIAENERQVLLTQLHALIRPAEHDNKLDEDVLYVVAPKQLGSKKPVAIFRARMNDKPIAAIISSVAPNGYNGNIHLLVAIRYNGELAGVRVIKHRETPGLGDSIDASRSDWIKSFDNKSLQNPISKNWKVKRDGGVFDQFTGATITPRAVVNAVHKTLLYYQKQRDKLFATSEVKHATDH